MATIKTDLICNLNQPVAATFLHGNLFSQDNAGNTINVHVMENGEPATIGGTVSANVIRADGNTVAVSGAIDGNKAYVILPQACYAVPGRVEIIIKLTQNTTITTIAAIVANVYRSTTDTVVDPGTIIPSIQTLIAEIEEAVDSIPVDYSGLLHTIAADYSSSKTYPVVGTYVWQGGVLKRNIVPITTAETYTAAHWTNAVLGDDVSALKSAFNLTLVADSFVPNIRKGAYLDNSTGIKTLDSKYAYCNLLYGSGSHRLAINLDSTSYVYRVGYYGENGDISDGTGYVGSSGDMRSGLVYIPENAVRIGISARRTDSATLTDTDAENIHNAITLYVQTDTTLRNAYAPANALSVRQYISEFIPGGNSVLTFDSEDYSVTTNGLTISVKDGIISIKGKRTTNTSDVVKLTNGYELSTTGTVEDWLTETLSEFESGETYSIHNIILSGSLPSGFGVVVKYSDGSNMLSNSYKERQAASVPAIAQIVTARNVDVDVSFIPVFVHGKLSDGAYWAKLQTGIKADGVKIFGDVDFSASFIYDSTLEYAFKAPTAYKPTGEPTKMIIICHGLSSTISASTWGGTALTNIVNRFAQEGYAVIDVNQITAADWCNPNIIKKYINAIADVENKYNVKATYIYGYSMGSLIALALSSLYGIKANVISGLRLDLAARYSEMDATAKAIVDSNLGFTDGYNAYECSGWNKTAFDCVDGNNALINPNQFCPTLFMWGSSDTLTTTESIAKAQSIKRGGTIGEIKEYTGDHAAMCALTASGTMDDCLAWFSMWK